MKKKDKPTSDFRYDTGETKVPWAAVGEDLNADDLVRIIRFFVQPQAEDDAAYSERLERVRAALEDLFAAGKPVGKLTLGDRVKALESWAAGYLGVSYACFVTNATAGFEIAYKFAALQADDEIICPAITFIATIAYPLSIGAKVVFADVDPRTINLDPADVERKITDRTRVIVPVHVGGYPVDMDPIMELVRPRGITVLEDAAHAFGGKYRGRKVGTLGHFGAFSFHEVKNTTSLGEGGLLVTDLDVGAKFAQARFLGLDPSRQIPDWLYDVVALPDLRGGWFAAGNHSATEVQAVALLSQLERLDSIIAARRTAAEYLNQRFADVDGIVTPPLDTADTRSTHHLYLLQLDPARAGGDVQELKKRLAARGVTQIPHFAPLYEFELLRRMGYSTEEGRRSCPNAEEVFRHRFTHLPLYGLTQDQVTYLADAVIESVRGMQG
ncbi:MAG: DegT/DnrJ/EryC1/StrS family aminotransferase [Armatimonadota bacterium]|nr:MAG: DegT/DnrJ/EryC1/StrS family aminotransferase [Armatimonadota bacterium]